MKTLHPHSTPSRRFKPVLNSLECRINPATIMVTNLLDDGTINLSGSLRQAIAIAENTAGADEIVFAAGLTGTLKQTTATGFAINKDILTITGNASDRGAIIIDGGQKDGIFGVAAGAGLTLQNLTLTNGSGTALGGGALLNLGALTVNNSEIFGNNTTVNGGAILSTMTATALIVNNSWIHDNTAALNGGGIAVRAGTATIINSTLSANTATNNTGGGISIFNAATALTVVQSTFSGNKAGNDGGGVYTEFAGAANISNSTITLNKAGIANGVGLGGGIRRFSSAMTITSTIVAGNTTVSGVAANGQDAFGTIASVSFSLLGKRSGATFPANATNLPEGDAKLGALKLNGGKNPTHRLQFGSPAINKGQVLPVGPGIDVNLDQRGRGFVRNYAGKGVDIGSVEFGSNVGEERVAVGSDKGNQTQVKVFDGAGNLLKILMPYGVFTGGVRVGTGDFNGDGVQDIVTAAGPGGGPHVKIFDGVTYEEIASFFAYGLTFDGGVFLGVGDYNGDGIADLATAAGPGGGPHVQVIDGTKLAQVPATGLVPESALLASFFAFGLDFKGGVTISSGDFNGDGLADIALAAGPGGGPHIRIIDGSMLRMVQSDGQISEGAGLIGAPKVASGDVLSSFFGFGDPSFTGGMVLSTGDIDGDGLPDLIIGDASKGSRVAVVNSATGVASSTFSGFEDGYTGGVRLSAVDTDGNGNQDGIVIGRGTGTTRVRVVSGSNPNSVLFPDQEIFAGYTGGVYVG